MAEREPYEKPEAAAIDIGNLIDEAERLAHSVDLKLIKIAEQLEAALVSIEALNAELEACDKDTMKLKSMHAKVRAIMEVRDGG